MRGRSRAPWIAASLIATGCVTREPAPIAQTQVLPPATVEAQWSEDEPPAIGGGPRTLDEIGVNAAQVQAIVQARADALRSACHEPRLGVSTMLIQLRIAPNGLVREARVLDRDGAPEVAECVRRELIRTAFPEGRREVAFPVSFSFR